MNRSFPLKRLLTAAALLLAVVASPLVFSSSVGAGNDLRVTAETPNNSSIGLVLLVSLQRG